MNQAEYLIYFKDISGNLLYDRPFREFSELKLMENLNIKGSWYMKSQNPSTLFDLLADGMFSMLVRRNGGKFFSGVIDVQQGIDVDDTGNIRLSGIDETGTLGWRTAWPEPGGDFAASQTDIRSGPAETVFKEFASYNYGPDAFFDRRYLTIESDQGRGDVITGNGRFQYLLPWFGELINETPNLGRFWVLDREFKYSDIVDKTALISLNMELRNIERQDYKFTAPGANDVLAGDNNISTARGFAAARDAASALRWGLREKFVNGATDELAGIAASKLAESIEQRNFTIVPTALNPDFRVVDDYWVGHRINAQIWGSSYDDIIRSGTVTINGITGDIKEEVSLQTTLALTGNPFSVFARNSQNTDSRLSQTERF